eukprot:118870-Pyramimonas_sp.AAC.3
MWLSPRTNDIAIGLADNLLSNAGDPINDLHLFLLCAGCCRCCWPPSDAAAGPALTFRGKTRAPWPRDPGPRTPSGPERLDYPRSPGAANMAQGP